MEWNVQKMKKQERLQRASHMMRGKIIQAENIVPVLESVVYPNDRVVLEGDNQKQATFLSRALASVDPGDRARSYHVDSCRFQRRAPGPF